MKIQDDETLQMYVEESIEHLANIENDFLAIEETAPDINEDLVNKVYRAAHSIKGGAGFMGLTNIKNLTHEMENILGKIRSREIAPNSHIINALLQASDTLKDLINDVLKSNDVDIEEDIEKLKKILSDTPASSSQHSKKEKKNPKKSHAHQSISSKKKEKGTEVKGERITIPFKDFQFSIEESKLNILRDEGKFIYLVEINLISDIKQKNRTIADAIEEMEQTGTILEANLDIAQLKTADEKDIASFSILYVLFATILKPSDVNILFEINGNKICLLEEDLSVSMLSQETDLSTTKDTPIPESSEPLNEERVDASFSEVVANEDFQEENEKENGAYSDKRSSEKNRKKRETKLSEHETSLRVNVSLLDQLMTLAGELVLSRNQLLQSMASDDGRSSEIAGQRIDLITSELQEAIMLTRMQSIGNVFNKFPRVVRDLAKSLNKNIELTVEGKDVELDKTIIEAIGDPLTHLVRNAVDHGIEKPEVRRTQGKDPVGQILLKAYHEAGQVIIEITDDGKGLDGKKLAQKAVEKGLITEDQAQVMSDKERINLIFLPGFSTAEEITDVSGRGVGMDVVKTNLDRLGGLIDIHSELKKGSTIRIKLPLTLAIIPSQIVMTGGERYAIPQVNLEELLRVPADQVKKRIERVGDAEVIRLRGALLPLVKLSDIIGIDPVYLDPDTMEMKSDRRKSILDRRSKKSPYFKDSSSESNKSLTAEENNGRRESDDRRHSPSSALNIVVVSTGAMRYGLVVDALNDSEEIVVKPLGRDLKNCKGYAGATIMGDGRVALILDVGNLAQMSGLTSIDRSDRAADVAKANKENIQRQKDMQSLLLFRSAENEQFAAPLNLVERIEKIKISDVEVVGGRRVIKYRGSSLPLFSIDEVATVSPIADKETLLVIVFIVRGKEVGLLATGPVDAVEISIDIDPETLKQRGIMGSAIVNNMTTQLVDIFEIVQILNPEWFKDKKSIKTKDGESPTILFAEDSNFFRNQVKGTMVEEGYEVIEAEDGVIAWDLLNENREKVRIVVTDIEMPNMNGFELTKKIRSDAEFSHLPIIALTTLAGEDDINTGKRLGIDDYQIKLDREKLLQSIHGYLKRL